MKLCPDLAVSGPASLALPEELAHAAQGIPLWKRDGSIRAFALVEPIDYERFNKWRWYGHRGNRAGTVFYVARKQRIDGRDRVVFLHREIVGLGIDEPYEVDHIDGETLNNCRVNLRLVTRKQQVQNQRARGGLSDYRGVTFNPDRQRWQAQVRHEGVLHNLGYFKAETDAAEAAAAFRRKHMPFSTN